MTLHTSQRKLSKFIALWCHIFWIHCTKNCWNRLIFEGVTFIWQWP